MSVADASLSFSQESEAQFRRLGMTGSNKVIELKR
jgi:hypothetical protein